MQDGLGVFVSQRCVLPDWKASYERQWPALPEHEEVPGVQEGAPQVSAGKWVGLENSAALCSALVAGRSESEGDWGNKRRAGCPERHYRRRGVWPTPQVSSRTRCCPCSQVQGRP